MFPSGNPYESDKTLSAEAAAQLARSLSAAELSSRRFCADKAATIRSSMGRNPARYLMTREKYDTRIEQYEGKAHVVSFLNKCIDYGMSIERKTARGEHDDISK